jgi:5-methylcytosine-specific restriction endonuclease McrA
MGGADDETNLRPAHKRCHLRKTVTDVAAIAKAKRIEAKHIGATRPKQKIQSRGFNQYTDNSKQTTVRF